MNICGENRHLRQAANRYLLYYNDDTLTNKRETNLDKENNEILKQIIERNRNDIAFVVGNGINRYPNNPNAFSWDDLLIQLWDRVSLQTSAETYAEQFAGSIKL